MLSARAERCGAARDLALLGDRMRDPGTVDITGEILEKALGIMEGHRIRMRGRGDTDLDDVRGCDEAISQDEDVYSEALRLAEIMGKRGFAEHMERICHKASLLLVGGRAALERKAALFNEGGRHAEAEDLLVRSLRLRTSKSALDQMGVALEGQGKDGGTEAAYRTFMDIEFRDHAALYAEAVSSYERGRYHLAAGGFSGLLDAGVSDGIPARSEILLRKGAALSHMGDHAGALKCLEEAGRLDPGGADADYLKARSLHRLGDHAGAAACYERAARSGRFADAGRLHEEMLGASERVPDRVLVLASAARACGKFSGMPWLQYSVYLAQEETGLRAYDFGRSGPGPYSTDLAADAALFTNIIAADVRGVSHARRYSLTRDGGACLGARRTAKLDGLAGCIGTYAGMDAADVLDEAHSRLPGHPGPEAILDDLDTISYGDLQAHHDAEDEAAHVVHVISGMDPGISPASRGAVLNLCGRISAECARVSSHTAPIRDHDGLADARARLVEYGGLLAGYCRARGIAEYPVLVHGGGP